MRHVDCQGLSGREWGGDRTAPTVLWIHGLGESGLCFEGVLDREELGRWHHLCVDLPGYGRSPWPEEPPGLIELSDQLAELVAMRIGRPVVLAGHSMGGVLGLLLAERHPEQVRAFVDIDGNVSPDDCTFSRQAVAQDLAAFAAGGFDALRDRVYAAGVDAPAQRGYYASLRQAQPATFHRHSRELVQWSAEGMLAARRTVLPCPRVYIAGAPGGASETSRRQLAVAGMPVVEISPSGHWPFVDQPDRFVDVLVSFLASLD
jgi:pimeloyl-ACP methyl ester carboxylesterase